MMDIMALQGPYLPIHIKLLQSTKNILICSRTYIAILPLLNPCCAANYNKLMDILWYANFVNTVAPKRMNGPFKSLEQPNQSLEIKSKL